MVMKKKSMMMKRKRNMHCCEAVALWGHTGVFKTLKQESDRWRQVRPATPAQREAAQTQQVIT